MSGEAADDRVAALLARTMSSQHEAMVAWHRAGDAVARLRNELGLAEEREAHYRRQNEHLTDLASNMLNFLRWDREREQAAP